MQNNHVFEAHDPNLFQAHDSNRNPVIRHLSICAIRMHYSNDMICQHVKARCGFTGVVIINEQPRTPVNTAHALFARLMGDVYLIDSQEHDVQ